MNIRYKLTIRSTASPHLYLDAIKKFISDDGYLLPQTRKMLLMLKKFNKSFIQLPLQLEVVISPEYACNLERALSPQLLNFNKTEWDEKDVKRWKENKNKFLKDVKELYTKMGYEIEELQTLTLDTLKTIVDDVDAKMKKFGAKSLLDKISK